MAKLAIDEIGNVVATFIDENLYSKATSWQKFGLVMASVAISQRSVKIMEHYLPTLQMLGLAEGRYIDVENTYRIAKTAADKVGKVQIGGILFDSSDVESLTEIARRFAQ